MGVAFALFACGAARTVPGTHRQDVEDIAGPIKQSPRHSLQDYAWPALAAAIGWFLDGPPFYP